MEEELMRQRISLFICVLSLTLSSQISFAEPAKEWSFFLFLNGNNNLDDYGKQNILSMEQVGSSSEVNLVVQWASLAANTTERLYIKKSTNPNAVTSPVVDNPGLVDMGDYHKLVEFVRWGIQHYPAKHYFVAVWDHGGGWHQVLGMRAKGLAHRPMDISWDDRSGHFITTEELGLAMGDIAKIIGKKIDLYGSDACLMAMAEVANEMRDSVDYYVGSEETEPGEGWPYQPIFAQWTSNPSLSPAGLAKLISREYVKAYSPGGVYSQSEVTMSAMDLSKLESFNQSVKNLKIELLSTITAQKQNIFNAANATQQYAYSDYKDFVDFTDQLESGKILANGSTLTNARKAAQDLVIENHATSTYSSSHGVSIWIPTDSSDYTNYDARYKGLLFARETDWSQLLNLIVQ